MANFTIREAADRSGFSTSALRYYERVGLISPSARTAAGYPMFDEETIGQLAFVAAAKRVGCSLEEIRELLDVRAVEPCPSVQRRLVDLVADKTADVERRAGELNVLRSELAAVARRLTDGNAEGPCDDACACVTAARPPVVGREPTIACSLDARSASARESEWAILLRHVTSREQLADGGLRVEFGPEAAAGDVAQLAAAEQECCNFSRSRSPSTGAVSDWRSERQRQDAGSWTGSSQRRMKP